MKVKELIDLLSKEDPEETVLAHRVGTIPFGFITVERMSHVRYSQAGDVVDRDGPHLVIGGLFVEDYPSLKGGCVSKNQGE